MNPAQGRAVEFARAAETVAQHPTPHKQQHDGAHWVTINGHHVLIDETHPSRSRHLSPRDKAHLDKYYDAVAKLARKYKIDPALILGLGIESGFASQGTYLRTGDAFGMTGGTLKHMTRAASPAQNVQQLVDSYGDQIRGTGSDAPAFINALQGRNAAGVLVKGWKIYNSVNPVWGRTISAGIDQMRRDVPSYLALRESQRNR
jgi:hypothetical protein